MERNDDGRRQAARRVLIPCLLALGSVLLQTSAAAALIASVAADPKGGFLRQEPLGDTSYRGPVFIRLSDIGLAAGDEITVAQGGNGYYVNAADPTMAFRNTTGSLHAAFTTTTEVVLGSAAETTLARLPTALPLVAPQDAYGFVSDGTFSTGLPTDVPYDFYVFRAGAVFAGFEFAGSLATVPNGANFLAVGLLDSYTPDNLNDASDPLRLDIYAGFLQPRAIGVPEPLPLPLLGAGALAVLLHRRRRMHAVR